MTLVVHAGTGLTSCLSVRLHDVVRYRQEHNRFPEAIDSREQFTRYQDRSGEDVSAALLEPFTARPGDETLPHADFHHSWQWRWYDEIGVADLARVAAVACGPSAAVRERARRMRETIGGRTVVLYRGNDKVLEAERAPYEVIGEMAREAGGAGYFVQTDEEEFVEYFRGEFGDVATIDELARIRRRDDGFVLPPAGERMEFAVNYLAATVAMAGAARLVVTTGNTGLWALIYRGKTEGVWQYHGRKETWRRL